MYTGHLKLPFQLLLVCRLSLNVMSKGDLSCDFVLPESVMLGGEKCILGCSSKTCKEAVRWDMGLEKSQGRRDKAKLKWWYKFLARG